ncbi:neuraminidase-like domain-containing protein [Photobacterium sp. MCCC 1A19761]|uniref:Tc toxin subunit A-related protein n=1 Tax=Photobacterium sp. MCCC 1A19761 TaxID=3115000 RepID=UPI00307D743A
MTLLLSGSLVTAHTTKSFSGAVVEAWDASGEIPRPLASGPVDRGGSFTLVFSDAAAEIVKTKRLALDVRATHQGSMLRLDPAVVWKPGDSTEDLRLAPWIGEDGRDQSGARSVHGRITGPDGRPIARVVVRAHDRDLRAEQFLGETMSSKDGRYVISYFASRFARAEKAAADLVVRVFDTTGKQLLLEPDAESVLFNAASDLRHDIRLSAPPPAEVSEFEALDRDLAPLLGDLSPTDLAEDRKNRDVTFLSRESGWRSEQIEHFAVAHRMGAMLGGEPAVFYGILRMNTLLHGSPAYFEPVRAVIGIGHDTRSLLLDAARTPVERIKADIRSAVGRAILSAAAVRKVPEVLRLLKKLASEAKDESAETQRKKYAELTAKLLTPKNIARIESLLNTPQRDLHGTLKQFLSGDLFDLDDPAADSEDNGGGRSGRGSRFGGALASSGISHARIAEAAGLRAENYEAALAELPESALREAVKKAAPNLGNKKADKYVKRVMRSLRARHPTAAFRARLAEAKPPVSDPARAERVLKKFGDLDLKTSNLDRIFAEVKLDKPADRVLLSEMKCLQRVLKVAPDLERAEGLIAARLRSASDIVNIGRGRFLDEVAPKAGLTETEAKATFARAQSTHTAALMIAGEARDLVAMSPAASPSTSIEALTADAASSFPNISSLFKATDSCQCEHCRSVYSPAAYLVELLEFLGQRGMVDLTQVPPVRVNLAREQLFARRLDIAHLDLDCANAETPLPYIDLVCEILEEEISPDLGVVHNGVVRAPAPAPAALLTNLRNAGWRVSDAAIVQTADIDGALTLRDPLVTARLVNTGGNSWRVFRTRQTKSSAAELVAAPEYVNAAAYVTLKGARYAFSLPFDLDHVEASAYFDRFDVDRAELMKHFATAASPAAAAIAAQSLGLTDAKRMLINTPMATAAGQAAIWAIPAVSVAAEMTVVATFLDKTGINYAALDRLLQLGFIDPTDQHFIKHLDLGCDLKQKEVVGLDASLLDRVHRFLRLQRATAWTDTVLDAALTDPAIGAGVLNDAALVAVSQIVEIARRTGIKPEEIVAFYGSIPHAEMSGPVPLPFFHRTFLDKSVLGTVVEGLRPEVVACGAGTLSELAEPLSAILKLTADGFEILRAVLTDDTLDFVNLSRMYGASRLVARLKISPSDLLVMIERTGLDPFAGPAAMLDFLDRVEAARKGVVKIADMKYMLEHAGPNLTLKAIADDRIVTILTDLQTASQAAFAETRSAFDSGMTADEHRVLIKEALLRLPDLGEEAANSVLRMYDAEWVTPPDPVAAATLMSLLGGFFDPTALIAAQVAVEAATPAALEAARLAMAERLLGDIAEYLHGRAKDEALEEILAAAFRQDADLVATIMTHARLIQPGPLTPLLSELLTDDVLIDTVGDPAVPPVVTVAAFAEQTRALRLLHKLLPLAASLPVDGDDLDWLLANGPDLGWVRLDSLPYEAGQTAVSQADWEKLTRALALFAVYPASADPADSTADITLRDTLVLLLPAAVTSRAAWLDRLALLTGRQRDDLDALDSHFGFSVSNLNAWHNPATWETLGTAMADLHTLTLTTAEVVALCQPTVGTAETAILRTALKARYDDEIWLITLGEIMDIIRGQKRDALVAHLLAERAEFTTPTDLYDHFLIDVEMEAKMPSSRIVQAHGTIQTFVERSRMGLEPSAAADSSDSGWQQWTWMRNYRVWEANRKVWVYPENWIEPELLDDKSEIFVALEEELLQNEVTELTTEDAFIAYMERLDEISFLEVVAVFYQTDIMMMHVFGRTKGGDPAQYYYRTFEKERYWSPWRLVDLDITSDNLLAFVRNGRLNLAWPVISEETDANDEVTTPAVSGSPSTGPMQHPASRMRIQIALSEFGGDLWKPKKISQDAVLMPETYTKNQNELDTKRLNLIFSELSDQIHVFLTYEDGDEIYHNLKGVFDLAGCKGYPEIVSSASTWVPDFYPDYKDTRLRKQRYFEQGYDKEDTLAIRNILTPGHFVVRLDKTPGTFRVTHPHQFTSLDLVYTLLQIWFQRSFSSDPQRVKVPLGTWLPYFFENSSSAYIVVPGLYSFDPEDPSQRTASDLLQLLPDLLALLKKYLGILTATPSPDPAEVWEDCLADPDFIHLAEEVQLYQSLEYGDKFSNLYHPLVCPLRKALYKNGVGAMMERSQQLEMTSFDFAAAFQPSELVVQPYPVEDIDFTSDGAYSLYNWELFFHAPLMIARRLASEQRFEEAMTWYHRIFNPSGTLDGDAPQKYWVTKPFFQTADADYLAQRIDTILTNIADPASPERHELEFAVNQWRQKPFRPHVVARFRTVAYQRTVVMNYIGTLIDWGDYLFRQDTMESITQAIQLYQLADKLLGRKPSNVPSSVEVTAMTYNQLVADLDAFGNALVDLENMLPEFSTLEDGAELPTPPVTLASLYFCIPLNEKALEYWDTVDDRLFKIRNSQNIDGVERVQALFAPPIDPGMLVRAAAAGIDVGSLLAGLAAPLPPYRFRTMAAKATELAQEVRSLGQALLSALESKDSEALALLRHDLEVKLLKTQRDLKVMEIDATSEQITVLERTREMTSERQAFYSAFEMLNANEILNLDKLREAQDFQNLAQRERAKGAVLGIIPDASIGGHGAGGSPAVHATFGGSTLARVADAEAAVLAMVSGMLSYQATRAATLAGFDRRWDDMQLQLRLSNRELSQIDQQIVAAKLRRDIVTRDLDVHDVQIGNAEDISKTMSEQYTNTQLYQWMSNEITKIYYRAYKLAFDTARKAEKCYCHELGSNEKFLTFGYWDSRKKGLQSANKLIHDIKRMEARYFDLNRREYELTKHISLRQLDPLALAQLISTGTCTFDVPEALFDLDHPGQYFRRIHSVAVSIPCVVGPYTSVSARLTQVSNRYRATTAKAAGASTPQEEYQEASGNDTRFVYNVGASQSVATSSSQNDTGLFELDFRDERYLPFEGTGATGNWRLELPSDIRPFDYSTISDVILHVRYTAREGGSSLRALAASSLSEKLKDIAQGLTKTGIHIMFNIRRDDNNAWNQLKSTGIANIEIGAERLPYFVQGLTPSLGPAIFLAKITGDSATYTVSIDGANLVLNFLDTMALNVNDFSGLALGTKFTLGIAIGDLPRLEELSIVTKVDFT